MKALTLALLLALAPLSHARADEGYDLLHGLAHVGAGEVIAFPTAMCLKASGFTKLHPVIAGFLVVGLPTLIGFLKEKDDEEHGGVFNPRQWACTSAGGAMVELISIPW